MMSGNYSEMIFWEGRVEGVKVKREERVGC